MAASVMAPILRRSISPLTSRGSMKAYRVEPRKRRDYDSTLVGHRKGAAGAAPQVSADASVDPTDAGKHKVTRASSL